MGVAPLEDDASKIVPHYSIHFVGKRTTNEKKKKEIQLFPSLLFDSLLFSSLLLSFASLLFDSLPFASLRFSSLPHSSVVAAHTNYIGANEDLGPVIISIADTPNAKNLRTFIRSKKVKKYLRLFFLMTSLVLS